MREGGSNKEEGNASFNSSSDKRSWRRKNTKERNASEKGPVPADCSMTLKFQAKIAMFSVFAKTVTAVKRDVPSLLRAAMPLEHWKCRQNTAISARERGFTMTELMFAVGIVAILTAIAAPSLLSVIAVQRVKTAAFDLFSAASYARSEAIKRSAVVTISPRNGAFSNGYDLVVGGTVLRSQAASPGVSISAPIGLTLAFDDSGRLTTPTRYQLELTSSQVSATPKRCVIISTTGRPTIHVDNNRDGNCING